MSHQPELELRQAQQMRGDYMREIVRHLWMMPIEKRLEFERELTSHLEMLVAEELWEVSSLLEATRAALRQFGRPATVGRRIAWEWHKENFMKTPQLAGFLGLIAVVMSGVWLVLMYSLMSQVLFPQGQVLITGSEGAKMSVENGVLQVASGQAGVIGVNPLLLTVALAVPFAIVLGMALVGCVSLVRRHPLTSTS